MTAAAMGSTVHASAWEWAALYYFFSLLLLCTTSSYNCCSGLLLSSTAALSTAMYYCFLPLLLCATRELNWNWAIPKKLQENWIESIRLKNDVKLQENCNESQNCETASELSAKQMCLMSLHVLSSLQKAILLRLVSIHEMGHHQTQLQEAVSR